MIAYLRSKGVRWDDLTTDEKAAQIGLWRTWTWIEVLRAREGWNVG